jgi:hypothetical protein
MDDLIGVWTLEDFSAQRDGEVTHPLGERPDGMLVYTASGWMSALLTSDPKLAKDERRGADATVAYAGRWERSGGSVFHHVALSPYAPWVGTILKRDIRLRGDALELTASTSTGSHLRLRWCRAAS